MLGEPVKTVALVMLLYEEGKVTDIVNLPGTDTDVRLLQPENAFSPIFVTESGIVTDTRPLQSLNAPSPMLVTESGIVTDVRPLQPENAPRLILVTGKTPNEEGIVIGPDVDSDTAGDEASPI